VDSPELIADLEKHARKGYTTVCGFKESTAKAAFDEQARRKINKKPGPKVDKSDPPHMRWQCHFRKRPSSKERSVLRDDPLLDIAATGYSIIVDGVKSVFTAAVDTVFG
ncbi:hypothetical protein CYMTET_51624, partial [Cymbomonas tetramitiformis]